MDGGYGVDYLVAGLGLCLCCTFEWDGLAVVYFRLEAKSTDLILALLSCLVFYAQLRGLRYDNLSTERYRSRRGHENGMYNIFSLYGLCPLSSRSNHQADQRTNIRR